MEHRAQANAKSISHLGMVEALDLIRKPRPESEVHPHEDRSRQALRSEAKSQESADPQAADGISNAIGTAPRVNVEHETQERLRSAEEQGGTGAALSLEPTTELHGAAQSTILFHELTVCIGGKVKTCLGANELIEGLKKGDLRLPTALTITDKDNKETGPFSDLRLLVVD
jgi:hypothetical protein